VGQLTMAKPFNPEILDRLPPQHLEAERSVLGSILLDASRLDEIGSVLSKDAFYNAAHGVVWQAILGLHDSRRPVDALTLASDLRRRGEFEAVGGAAYLAELAQAVPHSHHAAYYAKLVKRAADQRRIIHLATEALRDAYDPAAEPSEVLDRLESSAAEIRIGDYDTDPVDLSVAMVEAMDRADKLQERGNHAGRLTGLVDLDEQIGGFFPQELVIVAARPGIGKSAFALQIANRNAYHGRLVYFASLEMSRAELAMRIMCSWGNVNNRDVRAGKMHQDDKGRLVEASAKLSGGRLKIHDRPAMTVADVRRSARRFAKGGLSMVFVDYLQLMTPADRKSPREQQVAAMTRELKQLAKELDVPVVVLCQLNRAAEGERPRLSNLRESGAIEQDADVVIFLYPHEAKEAIGEDHNAIVEVAKSRSSGIGNPLRMFWHPQRTAFCCPQQTVGDALGPIPLSEFAQFSGSNNDF